MRKIAIFGATSAIAGAAAQLFAADGASLFLFARSEERLSLAADDLQVRGASKVGYAAADLADCDRHLALLEQAHSELGGLDSILIAYGTFPDQKVCEQDFATASKALHDNFVSVVSLLTYAANMMEERRGGTIAVISSVAGDRGRRSNYVYGSAKGGLSIFLEGLRNRLSSAGVAVVTIKPGFVDTPMTAAIKKSALFVKPDVVARGIYRAMQKKKDVVYLPWFWRLIMLVVKAVPEALFKRQRMI